MVKKKPNYPPLAADVEQVKSLVSFLPHSYHQLAVDGMLVQQHEKMLACQLGQWCPPVVSSVVFN